MIRGALHVEHERQRPIMYALAEGMRACGDVAAIGQFRPAWAESSFVCVWGARPTVPDYLSQLPVLYLEAGYINGTSGDYVSRRLRFVAAEWEGLRGEARLPEGEPAADRWEALGIPVLPWRRGGGSRALVLEQHPGDMATEPTDYAGVSRVLESRGFVVHRRPHPLVEPSIPLEHDLLWADVAVTVCSTAAVEAVIAGVPTITLSRRSVAWPVTSHAVREPLYRGDRSRWLHELAYRQWTLAELASGEAWSHLRWNASQ